MEIKIVDRPQERPSGARERSFECANCGDPFSTMTGRASAYCGAKCSTTASAVRYGRAKLLEFGSLDALPEDIKRALQYELAHALGAGYDSNARTIPTGTRALVIERDSGKCVHCGGVGEEIDHIDGGRNDASNLRLLCRNCHHKVTDAHLRPITDDETVAYLGELIVRMHSPEPLLPCDDTAWSRKWGSWVREHESTL